MKSSYEVQLYSAFDGRAVMPPQVVTMEPDALAEYLATCLESGYEAVVDCPLDKPINEKITKGGAFLMCTHEGRLRNLGHAKYVAELAGALTVH